MKYLIALLFFISSTYLFAQKDADGGFVGFNSTSTSKTNIKGKTSIFKLGIIPFFFGQVYGTGELRFNYERVVAKQQSVLVGLSYDFPNLLGLALYSSGASGGRGSNGGYSGYGSRPGILDANYAFEGVRGMLGYRYYFLKRRGAPYGIYIGPYLSYNFLTVSEKAAPQNYEGLNYFDACAVFGVQAISSKHFVFDFTAGLGYKDNFISRPNSDMSLNPQTINIIPFDHVKFLIQLNFGYGL